MVERSKQPDQEAAYSAGESDRQVLTISRQATREATAAAERTRAWISFCSATPSALLVTSRSD
jgi:hypothetical protein